MTKSNRCDLMALATSGVQKLSPYVPGKAASELERELGISNIVKLASNENPLGPSDLVRQALLDQVDELSRYPDGNGFALKQALSEHHNIAAEMITLGNGSNDVLDVIARVFLQPGRNSVFSQHAFAVYPLATLAVGADAKVVPAKDYGHDLPAMAKAIDEHTGVVFIANPNNPTGTWFEKEEFLAFMQQVPVSVIVVLDEAYAEYMHAPEYANGFELLAQYPNLIVTRTFSKAYGLASLRVGFSASHPDVANLLNRVRNPFNVNSFALAGAEAALKDVAHLNKAIAVNDLGLQQLRSGLTEMGLSVIDSVTNFICFNCADNVTEINTALLHKGVIVRPVENYDLPGFIRVSVGTAEENTRFLDALKSVRSERA